MENSIKRFTTELNNGLYLIDMPTGIGKTYKAIEYIFNHFDEDRKFFYITSLNKNVDSAYDDLKKMFHKVGRDADFLNGCIRLYSNAEKVIEVLVTIEVSNDPLMKLDSFRTLKNEVDMYHSIKNSTFNESAAILERIEKDIKDVT